MASGTDIGRCDSRLGPPVKSLVAPCGAGQHGATQREVPRGKGRCTKVGLPPLLVSDRDDMVVKTMSWAARALAQREPRAEADFVTAHEDQLARRVIPEVRNKIQTGRKNG
jgi:hypothetical protein